MSGCGPITEHGTLPDVSEFYRDYIPPVDFAALTRRLLTYVPAQYLRGLRRIVLTNASGLSHDRKRAKTWSRKRKMRIAEALGTYRQAWQSAPAWIEIYVDNVAHGYPAFVWRVPLLRDLLFAPTLFHEIGHHIHRTARPEYREREDVAEEWERRLSTRYFFRRYWYLLPIMYPIGAVRLVRQIRRRRSRQAKRP